MAWHRGASRLVLAAAIVCTAAVGSQGVIGQRAEGATTQSITEAGSAFWPADPVDIAVIANRKRFAVTDGVTTVDLGSVPSGSSRWVDVGAAGESELVAMVGGILERELVVVT